jgi:citrate synthase
METTPKGESRAIYEFGRKKEQAPGPGELPRVDDANNLQTCHHLIAGVASVAAAVQRVRENHFPIEPDPALSHAANLLYMITGKKPTPLEERVMDIALILHADHGMNASTFASLVVASTLSDIYYSVGSGIAALNGPLHGGANAVVMGLLKKLGSPKAAPAYVRKALKRKQKVPGFGHRVYKAYDPRARILAPLVRALVKKNRAMKPLADTAQALEKETVAALGKRKIFPNVDFYSGLAYTALGIPQDMFTPLFAVSRVSGWTARVMEYLKTNRIFRPRAVYVGPLNRPYVPIRKRGPTRSKR